MSRIIRISALEVLDSRGRPTVQASCTLATGAAGTVSIPSGASTGTAEALELRDGDRSRYGGLGCRKAIANIEEIIAAKLTGAQFAGQMELDAALVELDGSPNKSTLGANAILAISLAFARARAQELEQPLYSYFAHLLNAPPRQRLPQLTINLFSGGKHAGGQVAIQDVLIVPMAQSIAESLEQAYAVYQSAADLAREKYDARALVADEGGLAPPFEDSSAMLSSAIAAIKGAGLDPGSHVKLAVDAAATHFFKQGRYQIDGRQLDPTEMIGLVLGWCERWPILSVEDGLAEEDWLNWRDLRIRLPSSTRVLGDDLLCTNPERIQRAIKERAADALLLKVNQIGTLTEAAAACDLARSAHWMVTVSARSGETEDTWLADLAVAWGDQIKVGSITRSERLAKYNRLLAIEAETGWPIAESLGYSSSGSGEGGPSSSASGSGSAS